MIIEGRFVNLREIEEKDLENMVKWRNAPEIRKNFFDRTPLTMEKQSEWFRGYRGSQDQKMFIIETADGVSIGTAAIVDIDLDKRQAEWGRFLIGETSYRMGPYAAEAEFLIIKYAFDGLGLNKLYCRTFTWNEKVISMHRRFGFKTERVVKNIVGGEDAVAMCLDRRDYTSVKEKFEAFFKKM